MEIAVVPAEVQDEPRRRHEEHPLPAFDEVQALDLLDNDRDLLEEMIDLYRQNEAEMVGRLQDALEAKDSDSVFRMAHRLKGCLASFGAKPAAEAAHQVEIPARSGDVEQAAASNRKLLIELDNLRIALRKYPLRG